MGAKNSWGRINYLRAMKQARHCVTIRWPLGEMEWMVGVVNPLPKKKIMK